MFQSRDDIRRFVAGLRIPASRKTLVEAELLDHLDSRISAELAAGASAGEAEASALAALGDPAALRASLERIEPAFELDPVRTTARGLAVALATSGVFVALGAIFQVDEPYGLVITIGAMIAAVGGATVWLLSPLGIGAALIAEARATVQPRVPATPRRRAAKGYVLSFVVVFHVIWPMTGLGLLPETIRHHVLLPWGVLGLVYGTYGLALMQSARAAARRRA